MSLRGEIADLLPKLKNRCDSVSELLASAPKGRLTQTNQNGKTVPILETYEKGVRRRLTLQNRPDLLDELIRREVLGREADALRHNIALLEKVKRDVMDYSADVACYELQRAVPCIDDATISRALAKDEGDEWANCPYEKTEYRAASGKRLRFGVGDGFVLEWKCKITIGGGNEQSNRKI